MSPLLARRQLAATFSPEAKRPRLEERGLRTELEGLAAENLALRGQLDALLREARANEDKQRRFESLEHRLIAAGSILELVTLLLCDYKPAFGIDCVTLSLLDRELELSRLLKTQTEPELQALRLLPLGDELEALYGAAPRPWLGPFDAPRHAALFGTVQPRSVALLPLLRRGELIGSLHFGSLDPQRYDAEAGTQFLERLAAIVGVCLESVLNQERLKLAGLTDMLTGVYNRRYFEHRCQIEIAQARRHHHPLACLFLDVDFFKRINDSHGHARGDLVLRTVGLLIQAQLRAGDTVARWGGEEFVVLLPRAAAGAAREIAERIRLRIAAQQVPAAAGQMLAITASIGLAMLEEVDGSAAEATPPAVAERLVAAADAALYRAKQGGRNLVVGPGIGALVG